METRRIYIYIYIYIYKRDDELGYERGVSSREEECNNFNREEARGGEPWETHGLPFPKPATCNVSKTPLVWVNSLYSWWHYKYSASSQKTLSKFHPFSKDRHTSPSLPSHLLN
jgi:hypothetical protein